MTAGRAAPVFLLAAGLLGGCAGGEVSLESAGTPPPPASRSDDGLFSDTTLQGLVDLQVVRDGQALAARLDDPDPRVRARAAFALGSVQDSAAVPELLRLLDDPEPSVRGDAAFALGQSAGAGAARPLLAVLDGEEDAEVRALVLQALGKVGGAGALERLLSAGLPEADPSHPGAPAFARAAARLGLRGFSSSRSVGWLSDALTAASGALRRDAAYFFGRTPATETWNDRFSEVRAALDGYGARDPAAMHLIRALGAVGAPEDTARILARLDGAGDWRIRVEAARAMSTWRSRGDVRSALLRALGDPSPQVGRAAAEVLAPDLRRDAALQETVEEWLAENPDRWRPVGPLLSALGRAGRGDAIVEWMERWPADAALPRSRGLDALAYVPGERADSVLLEAVRSSRAPPASSALASLRRRWALAGDDSTLHRGYRRAFESALRSPHPVVRRSAADAIAALTGEEVAPREDPAARPPEVDWTDLVRLGSRPRLILETAEGRVVVVLDAEEAPLTVQTVADLAREGRYDGVPFHRVVPNFVAQGGDFTRGDGQGSPGFTLRSELTRIPFRRGVIAMASAGKDTEGSQYFLTHSAQPHLDGGYTSFGWVVEGMDVVDRLVEGQRVREASVRPGPPPGS